MPTSLIVVALVVAWLVVLVPMIVRKRQAVARTADVELAARVVRSARPHNAGVPCGPAREEFAMDTQDAIDDDFDRPGTDPDDGEPLRRYRPGRGGFDPQAAALTARAKYAFRQRIVVVMILAAVASAVVAAVAAPSVWWLHGVIDLTLVGYLGYLRRQVRIEEEIRQRRLARLATVRRSHAHPHPSMEDAEPGADLDDEPQARREHNIVPPAPRTQHGATLVDLDDEDPAFDELDQPGVLPYRRAVGE